MIKGSKICGVSDLDTLNFIINHSYPPQFIGFIINYSKSKRYINIKKLKELLIIDKKTLSNQLEITAETEDGIIMGVQHKKYNIHGVQFHPESINTKVGIKLIKKLKKNIKINYENNGNKNYTINGIENRIEQIIANLLDNSISFSRDNQKIEIGLEETSSNLLISIKDEGPGFAETSPQKIFKRFYSNRPASFGKHSGLGLNIVKNLVELHDGKIEASNRLDKQGALIEIQFPGLNL